MEEEDEIHETKQPLRSPLSPILPTSSVTVAVAKKPPQSPPSNALALIVHTPSVTSGGGGGVSGGRNGRSGGSGGGGGGRDDCWSEEATKVLIEAWGDRFSEQGKGTLKQQQWKQVADIVNDSGKCKYNKTDVQCKNRIDTVKKKYKQEKAKLASTCDDVDGQSSKWVFFKKLEALIGSNNTTMNASSSSRLSEKGLLLNKRQAKGTQVTQQQRSSSDSMRWHFRKRSASETESESDPEPPSPPYSAESLPPLQPLKPFQLPKRLKMEKTTSIGGGGGAGDVAKAILGFTEAYEKAEMAKLKLMVELEKERMKFAKEMELQRMQFLKTQLEITQNNQEEEEERSRRGERRILDDDDHRDVKNNGNVSS
ncbi:unnamed protein product [Cochlearia groenlandica]